MTLQKLNDGRTARGYLGRNRSDKLRCVVRVCPKCRTSYPRRGALTCVRDGVRLVEPGELAEIDSDPLVGTVVAGRFEVVERIGTGGMGAVYRARQRGLHREVALKVLRREARFDAETVARFEREARAMSLLVHPNTTRVFDFGQTDDGRLFFAMELLEGEVLTARIERDGGIPVLEAIDVTRQILRSLSEAHAKGIVHRDLKPDNVFLARVEGQTDRVVKVLDFGIAKMVHGERTVDQLETQHGTVFGTPRYMSPEQAQGKKLDGRSDLYSVGVLLYQLVTGRAPFVDDDAVVVMARHIRDRPDPPSRVAPDRPIPASLERVVLRALEKDPARRFPTAEAFERALEATVPDVRALAASPSPPRAQHRPWWRRLPASVAVGATLLLIGALGVIFAVASSHPEATHASPVADVSANVTPAEPAVTLAVLDSEPTGAEVWLEGALLGRTPLRVPRPRNSRMRVEVRLAGHRTSWVDVVADGETRLVRLEPDPASEPSPTSVEPPQARARGSERAALERAIGMDGTDPGEERARPTAARARRGARAGEDTSHVESTAAGDRGEARPTQHGEEPYSRWRW
ncbi:MAG: protein kinase [Myxococcota bacterium]|nr:protein kinase [Myxococcota bacterium]MDW8360909.1 serine/threonine-protein kinase [Myxococcales bacterium]